MDLNREVAENVMGWKLIANRFMNENKKAGYFLKRAEPYRLDVPLWNPLKDLNQCFEVVEKMRAMGYGMMFDADDEFMCSFHKKSEKTILGQAESKTPNEAILKAALEAVK